jgi:hypothetical protein
MLPADKIKMGSKISKTMLANNRRKYMMPPVRQHDLILEKITPEQRTPLAPMLAKFFRGLQHQNQRDVETLAGLMRTLQSPRGLARKDAELFADYVRGIVRAELDTKGK